MKYMETDLRVLRLVMSLVEDVVSTEVPVLKIGVVVDEEEGEVLDAATILPWVDAEDIVRLSPCSMAEAVAVVVAEKWVAYTTEVAGALMQWMDQ